MGIIRNHVHGSDKVNVEILHIFSGIRCVHLLTCAKEGSVLEMGVSKIPNHHGERLRATSKLLSTFDLSIMHGNLRYPPKATPPNK